MPAGCLYGEGSKATRNLETLQLSEKAGNLVQAIEYGAESDLSRRLPKKLELLWLDGVETELDAEGSLCGDCGKDPYYGIPHPIFKNA